MELEFEWINYLYILTYLIILILITIRVSVCSCGEFGCEPLAEVWLLLHTWKLSMFYSPTKTGWASNFKWFFRSMGRDTSAPLSLEDFRSWACQAEGPVGIRGLYGQSGFYQGNGYFKAKNPNFYCCCSPQIDTYTVSNLNCFHSQSAAVLDSSGFKCSSLPLYIYIKLFFSYYHHQILVLTWCFLGSSFLFSSIYEFSIICLLNTITANFPGSKKEVPLKKKK